MTTVADVARWLDRFAPPHLAETWDNVGLLWGDPSAEVSRAMTCLTVTPDSADEAIAEGVGLIVSHHPILFKAVKAVRADRAETGFLWRLARAGTAVASPHTAFDNTEGGINEGLARRLGLEEVGPLRASAPRPVFKVIVFVPEADRERVLTAAFAAGAGQIGAYEECSFSAEGSGTFFGTEGANPAVGRAGRREVVPEWRSEVICPGDRLAAILAAIRGAHSYEEPAIDVVPLHAAPDGPGVGRIGRLPSPEPLGSFAKRVSQLLGAPGLQFAGDPGRAVGRVAIACGAADEMVRDAAKSGADALLTGEARFHRALEAEALGIGLVLAGHYATERPGVEDLARRIGEAFPGLAVWPSRRERDPLRTA
jgi:dinuclear metal center YbgI/SA1388 family protein